MLFYDCSTAPNPRRARMFIAEKGLTIETRDISIAKGEQLSDEFKAVNPRATIPVLVTDEGTVLTENLGIAAYLEAHTPEPPLMGRTADEKGLVLMWNSIAEQQGGMPVAEALRNTHPAFKGRAIPGPANHAQIPELAERGLARIDQFFDVLEARLQDSRYIACDHFTLADISTFVFVDFARVVKKRIPESHTAALDWYEAIKTRPSAQL
ncbi:glutathione S-transferase family protein [Tropicibacter sp. Alg240-R139]|uniref:glutathione S-transferase family protein n=1 Tax=Tropicibacter sp. Alg240-R139 TaxID=2305991 RepID=UPI0013E0AC3F|nr:glutathione S-transferase [Tropicibacter sp. Alg240-R139]